MEEEVAEDEGAGFSHGLVDGRQSDKDWVAEARAAVLAGETSRVDADAIKKRFDIADDELVEDTELDEPGWWRQGWGELKAVVWPKREILVPLLIGVVIVVISLGALTTGLDYVFGHIVVRIYGSSAQKSSTLIGALTILDMLIGIGAVAGILAHRGTDGGLSSLGGINQAQWATSSSAAGRRVDLATYVCVGGFVALSAVLSYFLGS